MNFHDLNEIFVDFHSFVWIFMDFNDFVRAFFVRVGCFVRVPLSASFVLFGCSYSLSIFVRVLVRVFLFCSSVLFGCSSKGAIEAERNCSGLSRLS